MYKWIYISICGMIILAATGCSKKEAEQATSSPAVVVSTPTPAATAAAATPAATATVAAVTTAAPAASASPAASVSAAPQPTPAAVSAMPAPSATAAPTPSPAPSVKPEPSVSATSSSSAKAELLYKSNCLSCHGTGLTGDYGPNLTKVGSRKTKEQIVTQIMNGKIEMPPFKDTLKADEVEALATWLAAMK